MPARRAERVGHDLACDGRVPNAELTLLARGLILHVHVNELRVNIDCPYCRHRSNLKEPRPGRFQPKCPSCGRKFKLTIAAADQAPRIEAIVETPPLDPDATMGVRPSAPAPPAPAPASPSPAAPVPKPAANSDDAAKSEATADFSVSPSRAEIVARPKPPSDSNRSPAAGSPAASSSATDASDATVAQTPGDPTRPDSGSVSIPSGGASVPARIGGYRILRELGRGAMGEVYLARQISLDRDVALKTIQAQWAKRPASIARFIREAYAAAQLNHHNIVQIYDLGVDNELHYFSMEFVRGENLSDVVKREGPLAPDVAVGYILQAARGLHYAHQFGMVHRDVKPANLMLNSFGVVKVADLGLVKVPQAGDEPDLDAADRIAAQRGSGSVSLASATANVTHTHVAVGTPAYMAPEQSEDAAHVDQRADIYSLGCTLFVLLAGKPPFHGGSALEVISKHRTVGVTLPDSLVNAVPADLSTIVRRMVARDPNDRYPTLAPLIEDLEKFLARHAAHKPGPTAEDLPMLESSFQQFNQASGARLRRLAPLALLVVCGLLGLVCLPFSFQAAATALLVVPMTASAYVLVAGFRDNTYLFGKIRESLGALRVSDWALAGIAGITLVALLWALGWLGWLVGAAVVSATLAATAHQFVDRRLARERQASLERLEGWLKTLRVRGANEDALREFVARNAGRDWEEAFEALFGYEAMRAARAAHGKDAANRPRPKFRPWRDWCVAWLDARIRAAHDARQQKVLQAVETRKLEAEGVKPAEARARAAEAASHMVDQAAAARAVIAPAADNAARAAAREESPEEKRQRVKAMLATARGSAVTPIGGNQASRRGGFGALGLLFGSRIRLLAGCLLVAGCVVWAQQNGLLSSSSLRQVQATASQAGSERIAGFLELLFPSQTKPLGVPGIGTLFNSFNPGLAGLILIVLCLGRSPRTAFASLASAGILVLGPTLGIPGLQAIGGPAATCLALGLAMLVVLQLQPFGRARG